MIEKKRNEGESQQNTEKESEEKEKRGQWGQIHWIYGKRTKMREV